MTPYLSFNFFPIVDKILLQHDLITQKLPFRLLRSGSMDEFGGGFLRSLMMGFFLALLLSFVFVWFPDLFRP